MIYEFDSLARTTITHPNTGETMGVEFDGEFVMSNGQIIMDIGKNAVKQIVAGYTLTNPDVNIPIETLTSDYTIDPRNVSRSTIEMNEATRLHFGYDAWDRKLVKRKNGGVHVSGVKFTTDNGLAQRPFNDGVEESAASVNPLEFQNWTEQIKQKSSHEIKWLTGQLNEFELLVFYQLVTKTGASGVSISELNNLIGEYNESADENKIVSALSRIAKLCKNDELLNRRFGMYRVKADDKKDQAKFMWRPR